MVNQFTDKNAIISTRTDRQLLACMNDDDIHTCILDYDTSCNGSMECKGVLSVKCKV